MAHPGGRPTLDDYDLMLQQIINAFYVAAAANDSEWSEKVS